MIVLAQVGWIIFAGYENTARNIAASLVTAISLIPAGFWFTHLSPKWKKWNSRGFHGGSLLQKVVERPQMDISERHVLELSSSPSPIQRSTS